MSRSNIETFSLEDKILKLNLPYTTKIETLYTKLYPLDDIISVTKFHNEVSKDEYIEFQKMCAKFKEENSTSSFTEAQRYEDDVDGRRAKRPRPSGSRSFVASKRNK